MSTPKSIIPGIRTGMMKENRPGFLCFPEEGRLLIRCLPLSFEGQSQFKINEG